jgi:tetratricopeptide (TPR) repeat protein
MRFVPLFLSLAIAASQSLADLESARDRQDLAALEKMAGTLSEAAAKNAGDSTAHVEFALAQSYIAEVAQEQRDKGLAKTSAETGIKAAEKAVSLKPGEPETHRLLGVLCGQAISANVLAGLKYGKCAQESINKAIELDPKSAKAWVSHGVGNYYLPPAFGGGMDAAIHDFQKAIELDPKSADAQLWLGLALRKVNRNAEARQALTKAVQLNPRRVWAKQQLEKTPAQ